MEKRRLFRILGAADREVVRKLADEIKEQYAVTVIREPEKALAMVKMREPVKESQFYLGEVMITEAMVEVGGSRGIAVTMGDDAEKTLNMAVIDAACNGGSFQGYDVLKRLEKEQQESLEKENALFAATMVDFQSMDSEVQG